MNFAIKEVKRIDKNTLVAVAKLDFGPMEIDGIMFHRKNDKSWVNFPSKEYLKDGEKKYWPLVRIPDDDRYWSFQNWAVKAFEEALARLQPPPPPPPITPDAVNPYRRH